MSNGVKRAMGANIDKIGLGVITRRRPEGLRRLLESFSRLNLPQGVECVVLIAENDDAISVQPVVDAMRSTLSFDVIVVLERQQGIPLTRNRVLDLAVARGCDYLTFVDDDDVVHQDWLLMIVTTLVGRGFDLVGGAIGYAAPDEADLTWRQRAVLAHLKRLERTRLSDHSSKVATDHEGAIPVYTHNWIIRLSTQQRLGVRFDETLRFTGGSDTQFYLDFAAAGARTGWSSDARVTETWQAERLSFRYLFRRARDQEIMMRHVSQTDPNPLFSAGTLLGLLRILGFVIRSPTNQFRSLAAAMAALGVLAGKVSALRGGTSRHYHPNQGK